MIYPESVHIQQACLGATANSLGCKCYEFQRRYSGTLAGKVHLLALPHTKGILCSLAYTTTVYIEYVPVCYSGMASLF